MELYQKVRREVLSDEGFQIQVTKSKRLAGQHLLKVANLLQIAGNSLIECHKQDVEQKIKEHKDAEAKRNSESS